MAINSSENQFSYKGRGPLDAKFLVKTYAELLLTETWTVGGVLSAYNGMITAVWLNIADTKKNGIYFLHDSTITSARSTPDVTNEANWHRLGGIDDLPGLTAQISGLQTELDQVKLDMEELQDSATVMRDSFDLLPEKGEFGKLYVAAHEAKTYIWDTENEQYLPVGDGGGSEVLPEIQIIHGGGPST